MSRPFPTVLAAVLVALLPACGRQGRPDGPEQAAPVPAAVLRLAAPPLADSLRHEAGPAPERPEETPLFADHFGGKVQRWVRVEDFDRPVADPSRTAEPQQGVLRWTASAGFLVAPVEVRAHQELELGVRVRVPDATTRPQVVLCEMDRTLPLRQELAERSLRSLWQEHKSLGTEWQGLEGAEDCEPGEWSPLRASVRTSFDTRAVWIVLSVTGEGGAVEFDDLVLRPRPAREVWAEQPGREPFPPVPGVVHPFVRRLEVLEDLRDGFVLAPPASVHAPLDLPPGPWVLEFATALLPEQRSQHRQWPVTLVLTATTQGAPPRELWRGVLDDSHPPGWSDVAVDLARVAGARVELSWSARTEHSADVVLIGAPLVRRRGAARSHPTILLVSLDTLRADRLGAAGYPRPTTPNLDRLLEESAWFRQAWSTSAFTLPAHASVMTGQLPSVHGMETPAAFEPLDPGRMDLLAARLAEAGYATAAFTGGGYVSPDFGFHEGFDRYDTADLLLSGEDTRWFRAPVADDPEFNRAFHASRGLPVAIDWLARHQDGPAFLFLHTYLVHNYRPSPEWRSRFHPRCDSDLGTSQAWLKRRVPDPSAIPPEDLRHYEELYDATLGEADEAIGRLVQWLKDAGRWEDTWLILFSDHGEEFLDHQSLGHGHSLYRELVHVPLLVHGPGVTPRVVDEPVSLADLLPTLLDLVGETPRHPVQGQGLGGLLRGEEPEPRRLLSELRHEGREWSALRAGRFQYLVRRSEPAFEALFDLEEDPAETRDLLQGPPDPSVEALAGRLREDLARHRRLLEGLGRAGREGTGLSPEMQEELRALGYLDDGS